MIDGSTAHEAVTRPGEARGLPGRTWGKVREAPP